jgi:hypothetical protein
MVAVQVRVHQVADAAVRERPDGGDDLLGERRELAVDHQHAVRTRQHADRASLPFYRIDVARNPGRLHLDLAEILLRGNRREAAGERHQQGEHSTSRFLDHRNAPVVTRVYGKGEGAV